LGQGLQAKVILMQSKSLVDTQRFAEDFLNNLKPLPYLATVVGLSGDLGSGKTAFSQSVAKVLGVNENVTSPTFVIQKVYNTKNGKDGPCQWSKLIHIDCYRLESSGEIAKLGWHEIVADPSNLILVEWHEKIADIWPSAMIKIDFKFIDETTREINLIND
jgi:tRNA threonylcarbamoyladenosine biosynthesis protein TsaE